MAIQLLSADEQSAPFSLALAKDPPEEVAPGVFEVMLRLRFDAPSVGDEDFAYELVMKEATLAATLRGCTVEAVSHDPDRPNEVVRYEVEQTYNQQTELGLTADAGSKGASASLGKEQATYEGGTTKGTGEDYPAQCTRTLTNPAWKFRATKLEDRLLAAHTVSIKVRPESTSEAARLKMDLSVSAGRYRIQPIGSSMGHWLGLWLKRRLTKQFCLKLTYGVSLR